MSLFSSLTSNLTTRGTNPKRGTGDFFGPFVKVKFYEPSTQPSSTTTSPSGVPGGSGGETTIAINDQSRQNTLDALQLDKFISNVMIEFKPGVAFANVTLTPPYDDGIKIIESNNIQYGAIMGIKWGYGGKNLITKERLFTIIQPKVAFGREVVFTISGIDTFSSQMQQKTTITNYDRTDFPSDDLLLAFLAKQMNYVIDTTTFSRYISKTNTPPHQLYTKKDTPIEQAGSDWELFQLICKGNNIVTTVGHGNTIYLYDRRDMVGNHSDYTFVWWDLPRSDTEIPMMTFTTNPLPTIFLPPTFVNNLIVSTDSNGEVNYEIYDPRLDKNNPAQGDPKGLKTVGGTSSMPGTVKTEDAVVKSDTSYRAVNQKDYVAAARIAAVPENANNASEKIKHDSQSSSALANTTATLTAPGHPDVMPPMNIGVRGVGIPFSGDYFLLSAKHTIGHSGYEMQLDLLKTTTALADKSQVGAKPEPTATPKGQQPGAASGPDHTP